MLLHERDAYRIDHEIEVYASLADCYREWMDFERYPEFVEYVKAVRRKGAPNVWHWEIQGPEGKQFFWDVQIDGGPHTNRSISWHTVRDADIVHAGAVTFHPVGNDKTRVHFVMEFKPADESLRGAHLHRLANVRTEQGLHHFKSRMERGRKHGKEAQELQPVGWMGQSIHESPEAMGQPVEPAKKPPETFNKM